MAERFVRVDLSDVARDFRPIAVEPGVPLLDRSGTNSKILFRWLGGMVAEPEWEGESVNFFVRDDHGGRLEDVHPQPASDEDLKGPLKDDVEVLRQRIAKAKAETSTERAVHKILTDQFNNVLENENRTDRPNYFFKYRDVAGRWRLVWCWGYQRMDQEPGPTVICTASNCKLLFVRRKGQSPKCPSCAAALAPRPVKKRKARLRPVLVTLVLLLAAAALLYWFLNRNRLVAEPADWRGRVGGRVAFSVRTPGLFGWFSRDVSRQVVAVVDDPRVVRVQTAGNAVEAVGPGTAGITFHLGSRQGRAAVTVLAPEKPSRITIQPSEIALGVGTTAHLKVIGEYQDGSQADLTGAAEWYPKNDGVVYALGGFVQGVEAGDSSVRVRYRATPGDEYLEATAKVNVSAVAFQGLEVDVAPDPVPAGGSSRLAVFGVTSDGKRFSVVDSSELDLKIDPPYVASVAGENLLGKQPGRGRLEATLGTLKQVVDFQVQRPAGIESLVVAPRRLTMAVGELAQLSIVSPSPDPVRMSSSAPAVVEVTGADRLVGRGVGRATVQVRQGDEVREVQVEVAQREPEAITVEPGLVGVPVDLEVPLAVRAYTEGGASYRVAPELLQCQQSPSSTTAEFAPGTTRLRGVAATPEESPSRIAFRLKGLTAEAPVHVVQAPLRLELSPPGPVELPLGQAHEPEAWAHYPAARTRRLLADRLQWHAETAQDASPGLELRGTKVVALRAGAGPLTVWATYLGHDSNRVVFRAGEAGPVDLALEVDRTLRLAGEPGRVILTGRGPRGDVELVPELAQFASSDDQVLEVDPKTGSFRAQAPGQATVTARHAASEGSAQGKLRVVDPAHARLAFDPASAQVAVDEKATLRLFLEGTDSQGKTHRDRMTGPGIRYHIGTPGAVRWRAPELVGLKPAAPFDLTALYLPYLPEAASAEIEVVSEKPARLRVVPPEITLAPGQSVPLTVQEQLAGGGPWREVRPDAVEWDVATELLWDPARPGLRPAVSLPPGTSGTFSCTARYAGQKAETTIQTGEPKLDPSDPAVQLVVDREPEGTYLTVGQQQRYRVLLKKGSQVEPAPDVRWPRSFQNEYVRWDAPYLTAVRAGGLQWLTAEVGNRTLRFYTQTIDPFQPSAQPPVREENPVELVILSDQGQSVQIPVGAEFDDFRIEARYPDGLTRIVTKKATMRTADPTAAVSFDRGRILGVAPGQAVVQADFEGASTQEGLRVQVTEQVDVDRIVLTAPAEMLVGETLPLEVTGFLDGKSVGKITGLGGLRFRSDNPQQVAVRGPSVTGLAVGQAAVTAEWNGLASDPATVRVVDSVAERLTVDQAEIWMRVGENRLIGRDFVVRRGDMDLSQNVRVYSSLPQVVAYDPETHSLRARQVGQSVITFAAGEQTATMTVEVVPGDLGPGRVVVEPALATLAPGQAADLRVFLVNDQGRRFDRTDAAVFSSSAETSVTMLGNWACAVAPGEAQIQARLPEAQDPGTAVIEVNDQPITELIVDPAQLALSVGDTQRITVLGRAASGTRPLFPQQALRIEAAGTDPESIRVEGDQTIRGVSPGTAEVAVNWADTLQTHASVTVSDDPWTDLTIDPAGATAHPGQGLVYQVTATRGGRRRVLSPADGLRLLVTDPEVARPAEDSTAVVAAAPGRTAVVAEIGSARAEAVLDVVPGDGPVGTAVAGGTTDLVYGPDGYVYDAGGTVIYDPDDLVYGPGGVIYGPGGEVVYVPGSTRVYRPGYGRIGYDTWWGGPGYVGGVGGDYVPPAAAATGLRFVPEVVRAGTGSPGAEVRVHEVLADGTLGRDVTADPGLEFNVVGDVARIDRSGGRAVVVPTAPGVTRIGARLGDPPRFADPELLVQVGGYAGGGARLVVEPPALELWRGETAGLDRVLVAPGPGRAPFAVDRYTLSPPPGQGVVAVDPAGRLQGLAPGRTSVVVTAVAPGTAYDGAAATVPVTVEDPGALRIEPEKASLKVGELTPAFAVMATDSAGYARRLPAVMESVDQSVLVPDSRYPGRFLAQRMGRTQVRAVVRGRELLAEVNVTGERFIEVDSQLVEGQDDFSVTLEILAAGSEGPLEYRAYAAGQSPPEVWTAAEAVGNYQRVVLQSPPMPYGPRGTRYAVTIEARSRSNGSVQTYPFTFRLAPRIVAETP